MQKLIRLVSFLSIVLFLCLTTNVWADYNSFESAKNARELIKMADEQHFQVSLHPALARTVAQFDTIDRIHVSGRTVYASWYKSLQMPNYMGKGIDEVQREFKNSNITLKIIHTPTTSNNYNRVYKQSVNPGQIINATRVAAPTPLPQTKNTTQMFKGFTKPSLIQGGSDEKSPYGHYETVAKRSSFGSNTQRVWVQDVPNKQINSRSTFIPTTYDEKGTTVLTLHVYKYSGTVKMINLVGLTLEEAKARVKQAKLPIGYIQDIYEETSNPKLYGKIFEQTIKKGTLVDKATYIGVKIYSLPKKKMPDLTQGWTITRARAETTPYYTVIPTYTDTTNKNLNGKIYFQNVKAGTLLFRPVTVNVKVYKTIQCIYPPDVRNQNTSDAIATLKKAGFKALLVDIDVSVYIQNNPSVYKVQENKILDENLACQYPGSDVRITQIKLKETILPNWENKKCMGIDSDKVKLMQALGKVYFDLVYVENLSYKEGNVLISSQPQWGSTIKTFDKVKLFCRKSINLPKIEPSQAMVPPDILGKSENEAIQQLKDLGFVTIKTKKEKRIGAVDGTVIDVWDQLKNSIVRGIGRKKETVTVIIADINAMEIPIMPSILGATPEIAKDTLVKKGFRDIRFESEAESFVKHVTSLPEGTVIATSPRGGSKCSYGFDTTVFLTVKLKTNQQLPSNVKTNPPPISNFVNVPILYPNPDDAIKQLKDLDLVPDMQYVSTKFVSFSGKTKPGSTPAANTIVKRGSKVSFLVYVFNPKVPSVSAISKETALSIIAKNGLQSTMTYVITDNKNLDGKVKSQNPKSGLQVEPNSTVELVVYIYSNKTTVPNLVYMTEERAINFMTKYLKDLQYKIVYIDTALTFMVGKVQATSPAYQTKVKNNTIVNIYVCKLLKTIPSVIGKSENEAQILLDKLGFSIRKLYSTKYPAGQVGYQHPDANSKLTHPGITLFIGESTKIKPSIRKNVQLKEVSAENTQKIEEFYRNFQEAYESKDESQVLYLIASDWTTNGGGDRDDLEMNLSKTFRVFDEIQYDMSNLKIESLGNNTYRVSYNVNIVGEIYDNDITHEEKSSVQEEVGIVNGKVLILKTFGGQYWSIK